MSVEAMNWAWKQALPPSEKLLLMSLADHADERGECFPSKKSLSDRCSISLRTVIRLQQVLCDKGVLSITTRKRTNGSTTSNLYLLHLDVFLKANTTQEGGQITPKGGDKLSRGGVTNCHPTGVTNCHGGGVTGVTPITTNEQETTNVVSFRPVLENAKKSTESEQRDLACAEWMFSLILSLNPNHKKPKFDYWANVIRLMRERDGRDIEDIARVFRWANDDPFWRTNILSPDKLRKQWDKLEIQMRHSHERNQRVFGSSSKSDGHRVANRIIDEDIERSARALGGGVYGAHAVDVRGEVDGEVFDGF
jgi:hypothetical protein